MLNRRQVAWFAMALGLALGGCNCGATKPNVVAHPKNLGESCAKDSECISTLCAKVPGVFAATDTCLAPCGLACPDPQRCVDIGIHNNNETFACAPDTGKLCSPCTTDDSCGYPGDVCLESGAVTACGRDCTGDGKCPTGYKCQVGKRPNGLSSGLQCVPTTGTCECTEATRGSKRACSKTVANLGTCQGTETCDPGSGFVGCDARTPVPETCDGIDNDCNGKVDDGLADITCGSGPCEVTVYSCADGGRAACTPDLTKAKPESCDGVDNDCNGKVDDGLADITCGDGPCRVSVAACADGGAVVCHPDMTKATAEVCDGIDNDCNGHVDDGFVTSNDVHNCGACGTECPSQNGTPACHSSVCSITCDTGFDNCNHLPADGCEANLNTDANNCGVCGNACTFAGGTGTCTGGHCVLTGCAPGHVDLDHDPSNGCEYACTVTSAFDEPDLQFTDSNCDGIDGEVARGAFVDKVNGSDATGDGTLAKPFKSVQKGVDLAFAQGLRDVYVSQGTYSSATALQLKDGVNIYGGYLAASGWSRSFGNTVTLSGSTTPVVGNNVNDVKLQLINVLGQGAQTAGASAVAVQLKDSLNVTFEAVLVQAGAGADGVPGQDGTAGADGVQGTDGASGHEDDNPLFVSLCGTCGDEFSSYPSCSPPQGGAGASNAFCSGANGGAGGNSGYETAQGDLGHASPGGAPGGQANTNGQGTAPAPGVCNGHNGANDSTPILDGTGGSNVGTVTSGNYTPADGSDGSDGSPGKGGGGGGGGGGGNHGSCRSWGAAGGGGGAGGCGGTHATGGKGGGASIGVWLQNSTLLVQSGTIIGGQGGKGGDGGQGGPAGQGAPGGGSPYGGNGQDDASRGGLGGKGGNGSRGGHAGGGGGGPSIGVVSLSSTLTLDTSSTATPGHGGQGGLGGDGNRAAAGLETSTH
jgi:hypothetical protein